MQSRERPRGIVSVWFAIAYRAYRIARDVKGVVRAIFGGGTGDTSGTINHLAHLALQPPDDLFQSRELDFEAGDSGILVAGGSRCAVLERESDTQFVPALPGNRAAMPLGFQRNLQLEALDRTERRRGKFETGAGF